MGAGINEYQNKFFVILFPYQQPIRLQMTLHAPFIIAIKAMWLIFLGKRSGIGENRNGLDENLFIKSSLHTFLERPFERPSGLYFIPHGHECK